MSTDTSELDELRAFTATTLGSGLEIEDRSRTFGRKSVMWRVAAADGSAFYLKRHEFSHHYASEVRALNDWVPRLDPGSWWSAPEVVASSDDLGAVIITELPGQIIDDSTPERDELSAAYRHAGRLARSLHDSDVDLSNEPRNQLYGPNGIERYLEMSREHLDAGTCEWVKEVLTRPDVWEGLKVVPMHGDYSPRNWIIEPGDPTFKVIDLERSRPGYWLEDIQRMTHDNWLEVPQLSDAFFAGYGRTPSDAEWRQADQITLITCVGGVGWAISHDDE